MDRTVSASLVKSRFFIIHTILFCPHDDMEQVEDFHGAPVPFYEHDFRQKITIQNKKGLSDVLRITERLYHMGNRISSHHFHPKYQQHPGDVHG